MSRRFSALVLLLMACASAPGYPPDSHSMRAAWTACHVASARDIESIEALFTGDAEFYHDLNGFTSGPALREASRRLAADCPAARGVRRVLVAGSLEVYPIDDYGAVQIGQHRFIEDGVGSSIAKFVHLWEGASSLPCERTPYGWRMRSSRTILRRTLPSGSVLTRHFARLCIAY